MTIWRTSRSFKHGQVAGIVSSSTEIIGVRYSHWTDTSQKVPTILSQKKPHRWGYQVTEQMESIQGVKLLLDGSQKFRYLPAVESEAAIENMKSTPIEVSGKYLKFLVDHAKELLQKRFGTALRTMQLDYILTVPAVWSDKAKDATLQAACLAGISRSNLFLLSEPEAAAVYAIRTIQPNSLAVGDPRNRLEHYLH